MVVRLGAYLQTSDPEKPQRDLFFWPVSSDFSEAFVCDGHSKKDHRIIIDFMFENKISKVETDEIFTEIEQKIQFKI